MARFIVKKTYEVEVPDIGSPEWELLHDRMTSEGIEGEDVTQGSMAIWLTAEYDGGNTDRVADTDMEVYQG